MEVINVIEYKIKEVKGGKMVGGRCDILPEGNIKAQWKAAGEKAPKPKPGQVVIHVMKRVILNPAKSGFLRERSG